MVMKFDPSSLGASQQVPPGVFVVGKLDQEEPQLRLTDWKALMKQGKSPEEAAQQRFNAQRSIHTGKNKPPVDRYLVNDRIDVWEDDNEVDPANPEEARWYSDYNIAMMKLYESIGKKRAIFNFATGTPDVRPGEEDDIWPHLLPAVRHARDNGHYLALHEYMGPYADLGVGSRQVDRHRHRKDNAWHGRTKAGSPDTSYPYGLCPLRYRWIYDTYLRPAGLGDIKLIITECGCDGVDSITPDDMESGSWTSLRDHFWPSAGLDPEAHYASMLQQYDSWLRQDHFVVGAMIFTVGSPGKGRWKDFDISGTGVEDRILNYIAAERNKADTPVAQPASAPGVTPKPAGPKTPPSGSAAGNAASAAGFSPHTNLDAVSPGETFMATWKFLNTGDTAWTGDYRFAFTTEAHDETAGNALSTIGAPGSVAITDAGAAAPINPGQHVSLTLTFTAPAAPGTYGTNWQLQTPDGQSFGPIRWLRAVVV